MSARRCRSLIPHLDSEDRSPAEPVLTQSKTADIAGTRSPAKTSRMPVSENRKTVRKQHETTKAATWLKDTKWVTQASSNSSLTATGSAVLQVFPQKERYSRNASIYTERENDQNTKLLERYLVQHKYKEREIDKTSKPTEWYLLKRKCTERYTVQVVQYYKYSDDTTMAPRKQQNQLRSELLL